MVVAGIDPDGNLVICLDPGADQIAPAKLALSKIDGRGAGPLDVLADGAGLPASEVVEAAKVDEAGAVVGSGGEVEAVIGPGRWGGRGGQEVGQRAGGAVGIAEDDPVEGVVREPGLVAVGERETE